MPEVRSLPVPDGLAGERVDAALARLLGLSRTRAAELATAGHVTLDGRALGKSDRLVADGWLEVTLPDVAVPAAAAPVPVEGMGIVYEDDDVVVVDKPVGVAAHPSPGWDGPTVVGALAAAGHRISTSGAAERQGIVHRLDVGTSGLMVVAKSERAYTVLKRAFKERTVDEGLPRARPGPPRPAPGTIDAPDRAPPHARLQDGRRRRRQGLRHPLRDPRGHAGGVAARGAPGDRAHPPDPGAHGRGAPPVPRATSPTAPTRASPSGSGCAGSGCTRCGSASSTPRPGGGSR